MNRKYYIFKGLELGRNINSSSDRITVDYCAKKELEETLADFDKVLWVSEELSESELEGFESECYLD